jgi:hypothetical protein
MLSSNDGNPVVATIPDGSPQLWVVWINSRCCLYPRPLGHKEKNRRRDPWVSAMINPSNVPYTYARSAAPRALPPGGQNLINEPSQTYTDEDYAEFNPASSVAERVVVCVSPQGYRRWPLPVQPGDLDRLGVTRLWHPLCE